jgi:hypothetical protein
MVLKNSVVGGLTQVEPSQQGLWPVLARVSGAACGDRPIRCGERNRKLIVGDVTLLLYGRCSGAILVLARVR